MIEAIVIFCVLTFFGLPAGINIVICLLYLILMAILMK
jgi:hypothetical protein